MPTSCIMTALEIGVSSYLEIVGESYNSCGGIRSKGGIYKRLNLISLIAFFQIATLIQPFRPRLNTNYDGMNARYKPNRDFSEDMRWRFHLWLNFTVTQKKQVHLFAL